MAIRRFNTFTEFTSAMKTSKRVFKETQTRAVRATLNMYKSLVKRQIGHYITESYGPYQPWVQLAPSTKRRRRGLGFPENEPYLRTGSFRSSIHATMTSATSGSVGSNDHRAVKFERGWKNIPPRPLFGPLAYLYMQKHIKYNTWKLLEATFANEPFVAAEDEDEE